MYHFDPDAPRRPVAELYRVARCQRWVATAALGQIALWLGYSLLMSLHFAPFGDGLQLPSVLTYFVGAVGGVFAFLVYWTVRDPFLAVVMGLGCLVPFVGLVTLVSVNLTAAQFLRANGIPTGWFGPGAGALADAVWYRDLSEEEAGW